MMELLDQKKQKNQIDYCNCILAMSQNGQCNACNKRLSPLRSECDIEQLNEIELKQLVRKMNLKVHKNFLI